MSSSTVNDIRYLWELELRFSLIGVEILHLSLQIIENNPLNSGLLLLTKHLEQVQADFGLVRENPTPATERSRMNPMLATELSLLTRRFEQVQADFIRENPTLATERFRMNPTPATEKFQMEKLEEKEEQQDLESCIICLDEIDRKKCDGVKIVCGHVYHKPCILAWLNNSNSCPTCRTPLPLKEGSD